MPKLCPHEPNFELSRKTSLSTYCRRQPPPSRPLHVRNSVIILTSHVRHQTLRLSMTGTSPMIIKAYRQLYRQGLHAVQYAPPARHILRHQLNQAFREGRIEDFDTQKVENTILFLKCAAKEKGLEHRILKTLLHVRWWDMQSGKRRSRCVFPSIVPCACLLD